MKIVFEEKPYHRYFKVLDDGTKVKMPSVTGVIGQLDKSGPLMGWAGKIVARYIIDRIPDIMAGKLILTPDDAEKLFYKAKAEPKRLAEEAADRGKQAHTAVESYLKTGKTPKPITPEAEKALSAFIRFEKEIGLEKVIASEQVLYSPMYEYCGTLDIVGSIKGKRYVVDIKTAKDFYKEQPIQVAAYAGAWDETYNEPIEGIGVIRLDKTDGLPYWKDCTAERDISFQKFLTLLQYYELDKKGEA